VLADDDVVEDAAAVLRQDRRFKIIDVDRFPRAIHLSIHFDALTNKELCKEVEIVEEVWLRFQVFLFLLI